ncbi:aminoglycoside phosphotransferase family protein [Bacteriovorax sp. Seq25_V]|uniref:aminoglycoside phosphotransferase family protein n=1 Tax=Bacteriovorax sp. Seq25_V TaxID=1201288 RepID=UPI000389F9B7|nr:phosphotransferase [Bacteriovorax sp. Seq25_V]EQC43355.1 phosphotransferase enzyme family protein [Bacteriovorax sp. Seq25_V]
MSNAILEGLKKNGYSEKIVSITKLSGDASSREYYRLELETKSAILSKEPVGGLQNIDFFKTTKLFRNHINTPEIYFKSEDSTYLIQEDIGDVLFQQYYVELNIESRKKILEKVIDEILKYQSITIGEFKRHSSYEFDDEKIAFEFDLAYKFFVKEYLNGSINENSKHAIRENFLRYFRDHKNVVCHRDMHSKNLMIKNNEILNIDYQDARTGPRCYDLVSFLEDCYFDYGEDLKEELKKYYFKKSNFKNYEDFEKEYSLVKCQRLFKALGSFAYLKIEKKKLGYEKYIGRTFENLRRELEKVSSYEEFTSELRRAYYAN